MCWHCWDEEYAADPAPVTETMRAVIDLIRVVDDGPHLGLHLQLDDWNLSDEFFDFYARNYVIDGHHYQSYPQDFVKRRIAAELACFDALAALSERERATAIAIHEGWYAPECST